MPPTDPSRDENAARDPWRWSSTVVLMALGAATAVFYDLVLSAWVVLPIYVLVLGVALWKETHAE